MTAGVEAGLDAAGLLRLLSWLSPVFPVGAFGWSHGLEAAIAEGRVADAPSAERWIAALVARGSGWNDLVLFAAGWRAASAGNEAELTELAALALALAGSRERRAETAALGAAFARAAAPWTAPSSASADEAPEAGAVRDSSAPGGEGEPYPVAVARACGAAGLPLEAALLAFAHGFAANLLSVAVRLVPLGQTSATATLKALEPALVAAARRAAASSLDDLGQAALCSDIAAMRHETLQPRLFRS